MGSKVWLLTYNLEYKASGAFKTLQDDGKLGYYHPEQSRFYKNKGKPSLECHKKLMVIRI